MPGQIAPRSFVGLNLFRQASVTLTDAQIKLLHTTPVTIIPSPGRSRCLRPLVVDLLAHFPTPYNAFSPTNWNQLYLAPGLDSAGRQGATTSLYNTDSSSGDVIKLNEVLTNSTGATDHLTRLPVPMFDYSGDAGSLVPTNHAANVARFVDKPLKVFLYDGNASTLPVTGGSSANTLTVIVLYSIYDTETKQFV